MTHEDYVSLEQAENLKELGFDWECESCWDDEGSPFENDWVIKSTSSLIYMPKNDEDSLLLRPNLAQAAKWLRDVKGYHIGVEPEGNKWGYVISEFDDESGTYEVMYVDEADEDEFDSYEEALSNALDMILGLMMEMLKEG